LGWEEVSTCSGKNSTGKTTAKKILEEIFKAWSETPKWYKEKSRSSAEASKKLKEKKNKGR